MHNKTTCHLFTLSQECTSLKILKIFLAADSLKIRVELVAVYSQQAFYGGEKLAESGFYYTIEILCILEGFLFSYAKLTNQPLDMVPDYRPQHDGFVQVALAEAWRC